MVSFFFLHFCSFVVLCMTANQRLTNNWRNRETKQKATEKWQKSHMIFAKFYFVVRLHFICIYCGFFFTLCVSWFEQIQHMACMFMTSQMTIFDLFNFFCQLPLNISYAININEPNCVHCSRLPHTYELADISISISIESHDDWSGQ